jgi:hypothetical protein
MRKTMKFGWNIRRGEFHLEDVILDSNKICLKRDKL